MARYHLKGRPCPHCGTVQERVYYREGRTFIAHECTACGFMMELDHVIGGSGAAVAQDAGGDRVAPELPLAYKVKAVRLDD